MTASWNPLTPSCWGRLFNVLLRGPLGIAIHYRWADEVHRWAFEVRTSLKKLFLEQGFETRTGPGAARYLNETRSDRRSRT